MVTQRITAVTLYHEYDTINGKKKIVAVSVLLAYDIFRCVDVNKACSGNKLSVILWSSIIIDFRVCLYGLRNHCISAISVYASVKLARHFLASSDIFADAFIA